MGNVYLNQVFLPDPITAPPTIPTLPESSELPANLLLTPVGGSIRGNELVEIYSYGRLRDSARDDALNGKFNLNWSTSGKFNFQNSGLNLFSTNGVPTTITHPTSDFRYFKISVDFDLNTDSLDSQDFFVLKFISGSNEFSVQIAKRENQDVVQSESISSGRRTFGSFQVLESRRGTLSIGKASDRIFCLFNGQVIFMSEIFPDVAGQVQMSTLSQNLLDTSIVRLSNFRDEPGVILGGNYLINQVLLDDFSIKGFTPEVSYPERGLKDITLFGRFGAFTKSNAWNYYLPVGKSLKQGGSFSLNFYGDKGSI